MEICSCAGGMALGFRRAGIEFDLVVDKDPDACASYAHNMGHAPLQMDLIHLLRLAQSGWHPGPGVLDLLVADPPCTPWSTGGLQKGLDDERDCMRPLVALIEILLPRAFLIGNVPGLEHANASDALTETIGALSYRGYCIDHAVLDAADFGVPQHRVRPFWFGHRGGACITWPSVTHGAPSAQLAIGGTELAPWVTCRVALSDLPIEEIGKIRNLKAPTKHADGSGHPWSEIDAPARAICARKEGGFGGGDVLRVSGTGSPPSPARSGLARTVTTRPNCGGNRLVLADDDRPLEASAKHKARGNGGSVMAWPWDRPATVVTSLGSISQPGSVSAGTKPSQSWRAVVLSERARARLQGFPDTVCGCNGGYPLVEIPRLQQAAEDGGLDGVVPLAEVCQTCWCRARPWKFVGATKGSRSQQIGMAMPPPLAEAVARSVREWFG